MLACFSWSFNLIYFEFIHNEIHFLWYASPKFLYMSIVSTGKCSHLSELSAVSEHARARARTRTRTCTHTPGNLHKMSWDFLAPTHKRPEHALKRGQ